MRTLTAAALVALGTAGISAPPASLDLVAAGHAFRPELFESFPAVTQMCLRAAHDEMLFEMRRYNEQIEKFRQEGLDQKTRGEWASVERPSIDERFAQRVFDALSPQEAESVRRHAIKEIGPRILRTPEVARRVGLTAAKSQAIDELAAEHDAQYRTLVYAPASQAMRELNARTQRGERESFEESRARFDEAQAVVRANRPQVAELRARYDRKYLSLLTKAQLALWNELVK